MIRSRRYTPLVIFFEASGDTALPASAIMPVLAGRCIALNHHVNLPGT